VDGTTEILKQSPREQEHQTEHNTDAAGLHRRRDSAKLTVPVKP